MLDLRVKTCCFTGHRVIPSGEKETIRNLLETAVEKAISEHSADTCPAMYQSNKRMETG